ncbi:MAG TPA: hypothetical protein VFB27_02190 [Opitutaceae bacterium]|nr:hypothetical protein [Opitutaceae bacterium]
MKKPPPLPADTLRRVIKVGRVNGMIFVFPFALLCSAIALLLGDLVSMGFGLLIAAAGWSEWHGARLLQRREARGINWLVRSQLYLLTLIMVYAVERLASYDPEYIRSQITPDMEQIFQQVGLSANDVLLLVRRTFVAMYGSLAVLTLIYQGGLALFYWRRVDAVHAALEKDPAP